MTRRFEQLLNSFVFGIPVRKAVVLAAMLLPSLAHAQIYRQIIPPDKVISSFQFAGEPMLGETDSLIISASIPLLLSQGGKLVHVHVSRADGLPFPSDADLEIVIRGIRNYDLEDCMAQRVSLQIKRGQMNASTATITQTDVIADAIYIEVFKDGRKLSGFGRESKLHNLFLSMTMQSCITELLLIPKEQGNVFANNMGPNAQLQEGQSNGWMHSTVDDQLNFFGNIYSEKPVLQKMSEELLGKNWLEISSSGTITLPLASFLHLDQDRQRVLRHFVQGGGVLILTESGRLNKNTLESIVGHATLPGTLLEISDNIFNRTMPQPNATIQGNAPKLGPEDPDNIESASPSSNVARGNQTNLDLDVGTELSERLIAQFSYGFGKLIVTNKPNDAQTLSQILMATQRSTFSLRAIGRRGVNAAAESGDAYWNWQIPEVSRSPVRPFVAWIICFSAIVGPGQIWYAWRSGRRALLIIAFPTVAFLFTVGIFLFAFAQEGIGTRCRIRSLTWYDARNEEGFAWSRQTYYSGWPPNEMRVGPETEVIRMLSASYDVNRKVHHAWQGDQQVFHNVLASREQTQFLVRHPVRYLKLFDVELATDRSGLTVKNTSGVRWSHAFFRHDEQMFYAQFVESDSVVNLKELDKIDARIKLQALWRELIALEKPTRLYNRIFETWGYRSRYRPGNNGPAPLMERELERIFTQYPPQSIATPRNNEFLLLLDDAPFIDRGFKPAKESKGLHCVEGIW